ncbi:MAG: hypothetical protein Q9187_005564, partial [Circinaria calcarea]
MSVFGSSMALLSGQAKAGGSPSRRGFKHHMALSAVYPLTRSQQGIWIEYTTDPMSTKYNLTLEWTLPANSEDPGSLENILHAIRVLTRQHGILRCTFNISDALPHIQEHDPNTACPMIQIITKAKDDIGSQAIASALRHGFDLFHEYPARWLVVQQTSMTLLYLVAHHVALDGTSMSLLSTEFLRLFKAESSINPDYIERFSQAHIVEELAAWGNSHRTSWFRIAVTLLGLLVHTKSKTPYGEDQALEVAFAGRSQGFESTIGQFANALPVKLPLLDFAQLDSRSTTLAALIAAVSKNISRVKRAERFSPLDVARSGRAHNVMYSPSKVAVTYSPRLADPKCRLYPVEGKWDLFFCFLEVETSVELGVIYDPTVFSNDALKEMEFSFTELLRLSRLTEPVPLSMIPGMPRYISLPAREHTDSANQATAPKLYFHNWFQLHAESNPTSVALFSAESGESMTYDELYKASTARAQVLRSNGVNQGDIVLLHLHRGFHILEWIVATYKAGGAFVYLDPKFSDIRKRTVMKISDPAVIITENDTKHDQSWVDDFTGRLIDHLPISRMDPEPQALIIPDTRPDDLAYMIFTSGSTGTSAEAASDDYRSSTHDIIGEPKGVMIEHRNFASFVEDSNRVFRVGYGSRVLQFASFSFDASILEWATALSTGACLCFAAFPHALVGDYLADVIEQNSITFMQITPSALATLPMARNLESLRQISIGGEAVSLSLIQRWQPRVDLVNAYGPTETAIAVSYQKLSRHEAAPQSVSVGVPGQGTQIHICDLNFTQTLLSGHEGEICVSGSQVGRGYRSKPDMTEQRFAIHPKTGVRMYRTGDRGLVQADGRLFVKGRLDRELKIRGYRLAPEEVEEAILQADTHLKMVSAQVSSDGSALIAFTSPIRPFTTDLTNSLKLRLPTYLQPSKIYNLSSLPTNANGKVDHSQITADRQKLIQSSPKGSNSEKPSKPVTEKKPGNIELTKSVPQTQDRVRESLARAWQELLGLERPPSHDVNFFDIGGHSTMSTLFPSSSVRMIDLFHQSTVARQAKLLLPFKVEKAMEPPVEDSSNKEDSSHLEHSESSSYGGMTDSDSDMDTAIHESGEIAIVGIAGRFPGARDPELFYQRLLQGYVGITERSGTGTKAPEGCLWVPKAGTLSDMEDFDHKFWKLGREEATDMDPQQRLFLEVALEALDDANVDPFIRERNDIGVFVGAASNSYHTVTEPVFGDPFQRANRGFVAPCISARTAYHLNLQGPNVTLNTNCASGTVALSLAVDALKDQ